ncbi:MAG: diaminopimelate epimerase [Dyella sp.]
MPLAFSKMHGIGNDFVLLDCRVTPFALSVAQIRALGDRHTGVGFDQLLSVEPPRRAGTVAYYGIWNTDGSPAGQCGNGVRCVAAWLHRAGMLPLDETVRIESPSGVVSVRLLAADRVTVEMGEPDFAPAALPFDAPPGDNGDYVLDVDGRTLRVGVVSMGNPHVVLDVAALDAPELAQLGPALTAHPRFAAGVNAGFVHKRDRGHLALRVHERGSGWTRACGTGACAAAAVLQRRGELDACVQVDLPGGRLQIDWAGPGHPLWMTGPAAFVFEGQWPLPAPTH